MGSIPLHMPCRSTRYSTSSATSSDSDSQQVLEEPPRKRFKLFASLPKPSTIKDRYRVTEPSEVETKKKKLKTAKCTNWAVNVFQEWREKRNEASPNDLIPCDLLEQTHASSVEALVHWFSLFLAEVRSRDGKPYTPVSLQGLLFGLLRHMRQRNPQAPNFMDKKDQRFRDLHSVIDDTFAHLEEQGVGTQKKYVPLVADITPAQENHLWELGVLGTNSPLKLLRAVYFKVGSVFRINGALKHRSLKPSLFKRDINPDRYTYTVAEGRSKQNPIGYKSNTFFKFYPVYYANPSAGERCLLHILDLYMAKIPSYALREDVFYLRPKVIVPKVEDAPWYDPIPVGIEKLRIMGRDICAAAGVLFRKSTSVSQMPYNLLGMPVQSDQLSQAIDQPSQKQHLLEKATVVSEVTVSGVYEELSTDQEESHEMSSPEQQQAELSFPMTSSVQSCSDYQSLHGELHPTFDTLASGNLKQESEIHIYESDHHCVYIYMHRCKSSRGRSGSCPPTFTGTAALTNHF